MDDASRAGDRPGGGGTLVDLVGAAAAPDRSVAFADTSEATSWGRVHDDAMRRAGALRALGTTTGARVALLTRTSHRAVPTIQAVWLSGGALVMLPIPAPVTSVDALAEEEQRRVGAARPDLLVIDPDLAELGRRLGVPRTITLDELDRAARGVAPWTDPSVRPHDTAVVQFTSGSTSEPRGVVVSHANVVANLAAVVPVLELDPEVDTMLSWLPLFHDMGLFGFLALPMAYGARAVLADPASFLADPSRWMGWMSACEAQYTAGPSFAYAMATRGLRGHGCLDLSRVKALYNGSEPIDPDVARTFTAMGARHRLPATALAAAYGMAEATVAIAVQRRGWRLRVDTVDRAALERDGEARPAAPGGEEARELVVCGPPVSGMEVHVVDEQDTRLPERRVGELVVRGPSVAAGYLDDPAATARTFRDGWLHTGDRGYLAEGQVVVCGRQRDLLFVAGRNVHPEDVERVAARVEGVRRGNVVAVARTSRAGGTHVVVVAEHRSTSPATVRAAIRKEVRDALGIRVAAVELREPGQLPKTSSGKLMRARVAAEVGGAQAPELEER